jgi:hypothetical protein
VESSIGDLTVASRISDFSSMLAVVGVRAYSFRFVTLPQDSPQDSARLASLQIVHLRTCPRSRGEPTAARRDLEPREVQGRLLDGEVERGNLII